MMLLLNTHDTPTHRHIAADSVNRSLQATCCRLLVNLMELMASRRALPDAEGYRKLVGRVVSCLCGKLEAMQGEVGRLVAAGTWLPMVLRWC